MEYFRIHTDEIAFLTGKPRGLFVAVWKLVEQKKLNQSEENEYWKNKRYFENRLPIPDFYKDNNSIKAITYFKNNETSLGILSEMNFYFDVCKKYGVKLFKTIANCIPGELVYEDKFQIGVVPNNKVQEFVLEL